MAVLDSPLNKAGKVKVCSVVLVECPYLLPAAVVVNATDIYAYI